MDILNSFMGLMNTFSFSDLFDVIVVAFIIYSLIKITRETRAEQLLKGILILIFVYILASQFNLKMLSTILDSVFQFGVIALLVVFQPELRKALEHIGRNKIGDYWSFNQNNEESYTKIIRAAINTVTKSAIYFKEKKIGALIVFERKTKIGEIIDTGTIIRAKPSLAIIGNIFYNKAPLHDGAMILKDGVIIAAGCILPLTQKEDVHQDLGTRHRAALGLSEVSDAVIVVVSEETGNISLVVNGIIKRNYSREMLSQELEKLILSKKSEKIISKLNWRKDKNINGKK